MINVQPILTGLAYLGGLIDGEGSIVIYKSKPQKASRRNGHVFYGKSPRYTMELVIAMTDRRAIDWVKERFGGTVYAQTYRRSPKHRAVFVWRIGASKASGLLKSVLPFLKIKYAQAEQAIYLQDKLIRQPGGAKTKPIRPDEAIERERCYLRNRALNQRGVT